MAVTIAASVETAALVRPLLGELADAVDIVEILEDGSFARDDQISVFCGSVDLFLDPRTVGTALELLGRESLDWVQSPGAGYELAIFSDLLARGVRLSTASGVSSEPIAQHVFAYLLYWHRDVRRHQQQQRDKEWQVIVSDDLTTKTLGIVGYGSIGAAVARIGKAFGMRVVALRRRPIDDPNVDEAFSPDGLHALLGASDYVVLATPLSDETRGLIGAAELSAMGGDSVLINVARGPVVDEEALVTALRAQTIRGAALDVVETEPLPTDSPLWELENCVLTPHDAGYAPTGPQLLAELFVDNLGRYLDGSHLVNEVFPAS